MGALSRSTSAREGPVKYSVTPSTVSAAVDSGMKGKSLAKRMREGAAKDVRPASVYGLADIAVS